MLLFGLAVLAQSCAVNGLTDDYKKLSDEQKTHVTTADFGNEKDDFVYTVNGKQLLAEIQKHDKALVYEFTNGCVGEHCKPMRVYEEFAKKNGYTLFLVMSGFANIDDTMGQRGTFESPLYAIDSKAYPTSYRVRYTRLFKQELMGDKFDKENYGGLMFFENGKFIRQLSELPKF